MDFRHRVHTRLHSEPGRRRRRRRRRINVRVNTQSKLLKSLYLITFAFFSRIFFSCCFIPFSKFDYTNLNRLKKGERPLNEYQLNEIRREKKKKTNRMQLLFQLLEIFLWPSNRCWLAAVGRAQVRALKAPTQTS